MAIAYDASSSQYTGSSATSHTLSHTCTGSNRVLVVYTRTYDGDNITGVTYNGTSMTEVSTAQGFGSGTDKHRAWILVAPSSGANNIVVSLSGALRCEIYALSLTGANQAYQPDASSKTNGSSTSATNSVTTIADNSWVVYGMEGNGSTGFSAGTNSTQVQYITNRGTIGYGGPKTPAGSFTQATTISGSGQWTFRQVAIQPAGGIEFDSATNPSLATATSLTFAHTCTGTNRILLVGTMVRTTTISGVTYAGVSMTAVGSRELVTGADYIQWFYLVAPATGANNVVISLNASNVIIGGVVSYTGAKQTGQPDAVINNNATTEATTTTTLTTIADKCWTVLLARANDDGVSSAGTGTTRRANTTGYIQLYDSNGSKTPAGSTSLINTQASQVTATQMLSIAMATSTDYPITASVGTFTLTGIASILRVGKKIIASVGAFTLTGVASALKFGRKIIASVGAFTLTGIASALKVGKKIIASVGTFTLTGVNALLKIGIKLLASVGTFTLTGIDASLFYGKLIVASVGTFVVTGVDTTFRVTLSMLASLGQFTLTGFASGLGKGFVLLGSLGTFTLTGVNSTLSLGLKILASVGAFTLTGIDALLAKGKTMIASVGTFTLTGIDSSLKLGLKILASVGTFTLTGVSAILAKGYGIIASAGSFTLTGVSATFRVALSMVASFGSFVLTLQDVVIRVTGWRNPFTKNSISATNTAKNNASATNTAKNSESWINENKS